MAGRAAIRAMWAQILDHGIDDVQVDTAEVFAATGMAVEVGVLTAQAKGRTVFVERFHALWVDGGDGWQIHRQIWNVQY